jgi:hypothetical protein
MLKVSELTKQANLPHYVSSYNPGGRDVVGCTDAQSGRQELIWENDVVVGQFNNTKRGAFHTPNNCLDILLKATENSIAIE